MKKRIGGIVILGLMLLAFSCTKPNDLCEEEKYTPAFILDHPDSVQINVPFVLDMSYVVENSCGDFGTIEADRYGNTLEVKLKTRYVGCSCTPEFEEKTASYPVTFDEVGLYELKLWVEEGTFETYVVSVYE